MSGKMAADLQGRSAPALTELEQSSRTTDVSF
jgi:hypothetical protein